MRSFHAVRTIGLAIALALLVGCQAKMAPRDVNVALDESLRDASGRMTSVEVHLIGANQSEYPRWYGKPVDEYWRPGDPLRATPDKAVMTFGEKEAARTLPKTDPLWTTWKNKGAMDLFVLAFIPGSTGSGEGERDPRRLVIPLSDKRWSNLDAIRILVRRDGLALLTPPKPINKK